MQRYRFLTSMVVVMSTALLLSGWEARSVCAQEKQTVVVHLSHYTDDLHAAFMALKLSTAMQQKGAQTTLVLDLEGVRLASTQQPQDLRWGTSGDIAGHYDAFVKAGGKIMVCPHCAQAAGVDAKTLRPGAQIVKEDELAAALLAADKILDY